MKNFKNATCFAGPLRVHPLNPRYLSDDSGRAVYLTGSHTWANFQDILEIGRGALDYSAYLDFMQANHHNFMRMWIWEQAAWAPWTEEKVLFDPLPYMRTGPGAALDGKPKFDLDQWNEAFFERMRSRVIEAGERGIYVSVMLFQGWSIKKPWSCCPGDPWRGHPFHADNNINGADGDVNKDGLAEIHSLEISAVIRRQKAFIAKVIDTVNDLDNVLYEIINEPADEAGTREWHFHMVDFIREYEAVKPKQHPVGMTATGDTEDNAMLFKSNADWISPGKGPEEEYKFNPPASGGSKVILSDTDHLWGLGGDYRWVWKSFLRGLNPVLMDPWSTMPGLDDPALGGQANTNDRPEWEPMRRSMGHTRRFAERMNLLSMIPRNVLASTEYCLANPGQEYLVYLPDGGEVTVDLSGCSGQFSVEWFDPCTGEIFPDGIVTGGNIRSFSCFFDHDGVLYLNARPTAL